MTGIAPYVSCDGRGRRERLAMCRARLVASDSEANAGLNTLSAVKVLLLSCVASGERGVLANQDRERADARPREAVWLLFKMAALHLVTLQFNSLKVICC